MRQTETDNVCCLNIQPACKVRRSGTQTAAQMKVLELKSAEESVGAGWGGGGGLSSNERF